MSIAPLIFPLLNNGKKEAFGRYSCSLIAPSSTIEEVSANEVRPNRTEIESLFLIIFSTFVNSLRMSSSSSEGSPDNAFTASRVFPGGTLIE